MKSIASRQGPNCAKKRVDAIDPSQAWSKIVKLDEEHATPNNRNPGSGRARLCKNIIDSKWRRSNANVEEPRQQADRSDGDRPMRA